jgi:hypothetical protein
VISIGSLDPWYWDRMRGWSDNPNQLAFLCAVLTLLSLHLADVATSAPARIAAIASGILPVYVGRLTKSDTCGLVLLAAGPIFIALKLRTWLLHQPSLSFRAAFAWFAVFALPLLIVFAVPFARSLSSDAEAFAGRWRRVPRKTLKTWLKSDLRPGGGRSIADLNPECRDWDRVRTFRYPQSSSRGERLPRTSPNISSIPQTTAGRTSKPKTRRSTSSPKADCWLSSPFYG